MGLNIIYSDYESGSSSESSLWGLQDTWEEFHSRLRDNDFLRPRSSSFTDLPSVITARTFLPNLDAKRKLEARMQEFKMNGFDSPYEPDEKPQNTMFGGLGPSYLRQKSWPAPEVTPVQALPRVNWTALPQPPIEEMDLPKTTMADSWDTITEDQRRVLNTLPNEALYGLLNRIVQRRETYANPKRVEQLECRFCKNNGERAEFYRSHALRARGRVTCPVLRAFVCRRCGAHGDTAHTLKYCPLATADERKQSTAIMHSVRMASGKRRQPTPIDLVDDYMVRRPNLPQVTSPHGASPQMTSHDYAPLDPIWEALERKLML